MTVTSTHITNAKRLLQAFEQQALIYEQLLANSEGPDVDPMAVAAEAAQAQQKVRQIQESVTDILNVWSEISVLIDPQLRLQIDVERKRIQEAILAVLSCHELLLGDLNQQNPEKADRASQLHLSNE